MERRKFSREYKLEAVNLVRGQGVAVAQAARDLDINSNMLRRWVKELGADPGTPFLALGFQTPADMLEQAVALTG